MVVYPEMRSMVKVANMSGDSCQCNVKPMPWKDFTAPDARLRTEVQYQGYWVEPGRI